MRGSVSSPGASEGQDQLSTHIYITVASGSSPDQGIHLACGSNMAMEINADPGCCRTMDSVMALHGSPGPNVTMASGDSTGIQISMAL